MVTAPSLSELKNCWDNAVRHMVWFLGLFYAGMGVELADFCVFLPPQSILCGIMDITGESCLFKESAEDYSA